MTDHEAADNSKWGKRGCGILILAALSIPLYFLGGPVIFAGIFVLGGFGYFLWLYQVNHRGEESRDETPKILDPPVANETLNQLNRVDDLPERVRFFVVKELGAPESVVRMDLCLCKDLGMKNEHGRGFMKRFAEEFSVEMSSFDSKRYFGDEDGIVPTGCALGLASAFVGEDKRELEFTVSDLVDAARDGRWPGQSTSLGRVEHGAMWNCGVCGHANDADRLQCENCLRNRDGKLPG